MSYPPDRWTEPEATTSATLRRAGAPPDLELGGVQAHYLATGRSTDGEFGLYRWDMGPHSSGAAAHFHRAISESFFVLSGTVGIYDGRQWVDAHPGDFVHVPPGGVHGFRNLSETPASMLLHFSPGAPREGYFERLPTLDELSDAEREAFFAAHDTYWT